MAVKVTIVPHRVPDKARGGKVVEFDQFQVFIGQRVVGYKAKQPGLPVKLVVRDLPEEAINAINRASASGGTSLGQAILVALGTITGKPVALPADGATPDASALGYWPSATIVVFSDGQQTGGPDAEAAAEVAAAAGVRIQTVGVGTARGATVTVDGFQLATQLDESLLTTVAQTPGGAYQQAGDAATLADTTSSIDLRLTTKKEPVELTAPFAGAALLLLVAGALLGIRWHGRIV